MARYSRTLPVITTVIFLIGGCGPKPTVELPADLTQLDDYTRWEGSISIMNAELGIVVNLWTEAGEPKGAIDIPMQRAHGIELHDIALGTDSVTFEMLEGQRTAVFAGAYIHADSIAGEFRQSGFKGSFQLVRRIAPIIAAPPQEPPPYPVEEVTFEHGDIRLAGTLTLPEGDGPRPALILVSGSGPQNRDEEIPIVPGYRPFHDVADHLTPLGFAVLRYDDRGVGESTGDHATATSADFAQDAEAALDYLLKRKEIDPERIGILGHSEGGLIAAMLAARRPEVAFIVSMAGSTTRGYDLLLKQNERIFRAMGKSEEEIQRQIAQARTAMDLTITEDWDALEQHIYTVAREQLEDMPAEQRAAVTDPELYARNVTDQQMAAMKGWMRFFIMYDPAQDWSRVRVPVLAIFGELDTQVDAEQGRAALEAAMARVDNGNLTVVVLPKANHLFQEAVTGSPNEYAQLSPELMPAFLETITNWLLGIPLE